MKIKTIKHFNRSTVQRVKAAAFTLAETLIVIGIIGVVAALTLPNLNHATGDKEKVTKVKKIYSALTDAFDRAQVIYGDYDTWFKDIEDDEVACSERFAKRVSEFMKVSKSCGYKDNTCFITNYPYDAYKYGYSYVLTDGMSICFNTFLGNLYYSILVDIDGPNKGKNMDGNDIFAFDVINNQLYPGGTRHNFEISDSELAENCLNSNYCTEWVIEFGNMEYLKANNGVCPNGGKLSWTSTDCATATAAPDDDNSDGKTSSGKKKAAKKKAAKS